MTETRHHRLIRDVLTDAAHALDRVEDLHAQMLRLHNSLVNALLDYESTDKK